MLNRSMFFLFTLTLIIPALGQSDFFLDTVLLTDHSVSLIEFSTSGGVAVTDDGQVFIISLEDEVTEVTEVFQPFNPSSFTALLMIRENMFFAASSSGQLFKYENGQVEQWDESYGFAASRVNSIGRVNHSFSGKVVIGTDLGLYTFSTDFTNVSLTDYYDGYNVDVFTDGPRCSLFDINKDTYCSNIPEHSLVVSGPTFTVETGYITHEEYSMEDSIHDATSIKRPGLSNSYYFSVITATNHGLRGKRLSECTNPNVITWIENDTVYDLEYYSTISGFSNLPEILFVASATGGYFFNDPSSNFYEMELDTIPELTEHSVSSISSVDCENSIWFGTDSGISRYRMLTGDPEYLNPGNVEEIAHCAGEMHYVNAPSNLSFNYQWLKDGVLLNDSIKSYLNTDEYGFYQVIVSNCFLTDTLDIATIFHNEAVNNEISYNGQLSTCPDSYLILETTYAYDQTYQWYLNNNAIDGAVYHNYSPLESGSYKVEAFNCNSISDFSETLEVIIYPAETPVLDPNYAKDSYCTGDTVKILAPEMDMEITWSDYWGSEFSAYNDQTYFIFHEYDVPNYVSFLSDMGCTGTLNLPYFNVENLPFAEYSEDTIAICEANPVYIYVNASAPVRWSAGIRQVYRGSWNIHFLCGEL